MALNRPKKPGFKVSEFQKGKLITARETRKPRRNL
jgi:hypothetical protein